MTSKPNKERFLEDVEKHKMKILIDDGVHRNIRFAAPGSNNQHFNLVTYPNHLVISGDMGTFVFSRVFDMFEFFRVDDLEINPMYWGEKVESESRFGGVEKFDDELVRKSIDDRVDDICKNIYDFEYDKEAYGYDELEDMFRDEVYDYFKYKELDVYRFVSAIDDFESSILDDLDFADGYHWLKDKEYSYYYIWCCYAIVWGIQQYDKVKGKDDE